MKELHIRETYLKTNEALHIRALNIEFHVDDDIKK